MSSPYFFVMPLDTTGLKYADKVPAMPTDFVTVECGCGRDCGMAPQGAQLYREHGGTILCAFCVLDKIAGGEGFPFTGIPS